MACGLLALLLSLPPAHNRSEPSPHRAPAVACEQMVECLNSSSSSSPSRPLHPSHTCPGEPECSGRGKCHGYAEDGSPRCECSAAFFGRDCSHKRHDCASLRSCADCQVSHDQNDANGKFCGWCADGRYCVPKHVHRGLVRRGRGCATWYEDSCPARNRSVSRGGPEAGMISEFGDDTSVALAEALVAMIDEAGGEGTSSRLAVTSVLGLSALTLWCLRRERKAVERRRRFEEFMAEEQRMLHSSEPVHLSLPVSCRQLGPTADEARGLNASAMAEALGMSGGGGASHASLPPSKPPTRTHCVVERSAASPEARERVEDKASVEEEKEEERMHFEFRGGLVAWQVRQDIEERKAQRRAATEEAREKAAAEKREAAEQAVLQQLRGEAQMMRQAQPTSTLTTVTCSSGSPAEAFLHPTLALLHLRPSPTLPLILQPNPPPPLNLQPAQPQALNLRPHKPPPLKLQRPPCQRPAPSGQQLILLALTRSQPPSNSTLRQRPWLLPQSLRVTPCRNLLKRKPSESQSRLF
ncbi:MAG: hypothetical protein SGPRY_003122 [Prymnesium sp.]